jgi:glycerol kinase
MDVSLLMSYILVLDIVTTNIKSFIFNKQGNIISEAKRRPNYIMNEPGQVEQDPNEIWQMIKEVIGETLNAKNVKANEINSMAISTQRASFCIWNKKTGKLYSNIIT